MPNEIVTIYKPVYVSSLHMCSGSIEADSIQSDSFSPDKIDYTLCVYPDRVGKYGEQCKRLYTVSSTDEIVVSSTCVYWPYSLYLERRLISKLQSDDYKTPKNSYLILYSSRRVQNKYRGAASPCVQVCIQSHWLEAVELPQENADFEELAYSDLLKL